MAVTEPEHVVTGGPHDPSTGFTGPGGNTPTGGTQHRSPDGLWEWDPTRQQWMPVQGQPSIGAPAARRRRRGRLLVIVAVLVVAAVIAGVVLALNSGSGSGSQDASARSGTQADPGITDRATACHKELGSLLDLYLQNGVEPLLGVIGTQSPLFSMTQSVGATYSQDVSSFGQSTAQERIQPVITRACSQAGNPLLTRGQVADLANRLGPTPDTETLNRIRVFS